jgi:exopolysaccharide production protein ExoZ
MIAHVAHGPPSKLEGLQVARALAALSIAYYHSWHVTLPFPPGTAYPIPWLRDHGSLAVEFFFAISGFVICLLVTSPKFEPSRFAIQRFFRLWPLWIATSFFFLDLTDYIGRSPTQTKTAFWYSLTLLPTEGYPFYDIGWSLQHEVAFYLLAACCIRLGIYALAAVLGIGALLDSFVTLPWYLHQYFTYYPYFLAGIAAFLIKPVISRVGVIGPIAAGVLLLAILPRTALPIAMFALLTGFINLKPRTFVGRGLVALGDASYSIYLIHPLIFLHIYARLQPPLPPNWMQEPLRYGALLVICVLSLLSWRFFEKPMIAIGNTIARYGMWVRSKPRGELSPIEDLPVVKEANVKAE